MTVTVALEVVVLLETAIAQKRVLSHMDCGGDVFVKVDLL